MKSFRLRKELQPFVSKELEEKNISYILQDEFLITDLSGNQFHRMVVNALCTKQQLESSNPDIPVLSWDILSNERALYGQIKKHPQTLFSVLEQDIAKITQIKVVINEPSSLFKETVNSIYRNIHEEVPLSKDKGKEQKFYFLQNTCLIESIIQIELLQRSVSFADNGDGMFGFPIVFNDSIAFGKEANGDIYCAANALFILIEHQKVKGILPFYAALKEW